MLYSVNKLNGYAIQATDGEIGKAEEFYFDDEEWTVRYLIVNTGNWLAEREVLISPLALEQPQREEQKLPVTLNKEQVENSPKAEKLRPISRQKEVEIFSYYSWTPYWTPITNFAGPPPTPPHETVLSAETEEEVKEQKRPRDPHLRSTDEVEGYYIQALDDDVGHVEDFIMDTENWTIRYMVIDTRNWLPGRKVLISPLWTERIDWSEKEVHVNMTREEIKNSPEYDESNPISREYERRLHDHYEQPFYKDEPEAIQTL